MRTQLVTGHYVDSNTHSSWKAPTNENFEKGDLIVVSAAQGMQIAVVDAFITIDTAIEQETVCFIEAVTGQPIKQIRKVVGKVKPMEIEGEEEL
jgi:hypothetical protein